MSKKKLDWQIYEEEIYSEVCSKYSDDHCEKNVKVEGRISRTDRQVDIMLIETIQGREVKTAIEAKHYNKPIDIKGVENFLAMMNDLGVDRGMMISPKGYSKAAYERAYYDEIDVDLDIFSLAEFKAWQSAGGIPYAGSNGMLMPAPIGWVLEATPLKGVLAALYGRGHDFQSAFKKSEYMYVNFWNRDDDVHNLDLLLDKQAQDILSIHSDSKIHISDFAHREDARTCLRRAEIPSYPTAEFTAFAEFDLFILYIVMFSPLVLERKNLRKLEYVVQKSVPVKVVHN